MFQNYQLETQVVKHSKHKDTRHCKSDNTVLKEEQMKSKSLTDLKLGMFRMSYYHY